ncbi:penicillin G acylase [Oceaniovalibus guishaninsula JLT2003]|uniref:Penicillin G acylase n=1 Tax=Oceaniovalibus guishaninsula JLT2003 TaxID=1231392 RepID=K2H9B8_9RHOB|nr:penicillin acylase family protein [Oceaniovalibus guishaninsula]EKE43192.1 penicillin G acylase [Oceaniovalibus guishaninsula JLT2003]
MAIRGFALAGTALFTATMASAGEVTIKRDGYGAAHIYADNTYDLFYGYGHAIAQDRLFSLDMARRTGTGEVAAVLGPDFVEFDEQIRSNYWPWFVQDQIADASAETRDLLEGYAAGINAWIAEVRADPAALMPLEYTVHDAEPEEWTAHDVAMVFIGSMIYRFGDFNTEIENARIRQGLIDMHGEDEGARIFDALLARSVNGAPTTIPAGDWDPALRDSPDADLRPIRQGAISDEVLRQAAPPPPEFAGIDGTVPRRDWRAANLRALREGGPAALRLEAASNLAILGPERLDGARAVLINGPQFGWYRPAYTWSVGLHGAGFDVAGNTAFGYPGVMFAHNGQIAWGSTWAAGDQVDIFIETLNPDDPTQYRHDGAWKDMETSEQTIAVNGGEPVTITAYRTVHGPVVARDEDANLAYAQQRAWSGNELGTLTAWVELMKAQDFDAFRAAVANSAVNVNHYYADAQGNIGYVFGGFYPKRADGHDGRLPVSGEGDMDWLGIMPFETNPQVLNPSTHRILNWNNRPAEGFPNPDQYWYSWMPADRVSVLDRAFDGSDTFTPQQAWEVVSDRASFEDVNAGPMIPFLQQAVADLSDDDPRRAMADAVADWNRMLEDRDGDGRYDHPGAAIMQAWLGALLEQAFSDTLPEPYATIFAQAGYPNPDTFTGSGQNIQVGTKVVHHALSGDGPDLFGGDSTGAVLRALDTARERLTDAHGPELADWLGKVAGIRFNYKNFRGIPQTLPRMQVTSPVAMNRGTENNMIVFTPGGVEAWETVPPGQSGFIAPDGTTPSTYGDQLAEYQALARKRVWFTEAEVDANTVTTRTLTVER